MSEENQHAIQSIINGMILKYTANQLGKPDKTKPSSVGFVYFYNIVFAFLSIDK